MRHMSSCVLALSAFFASAEFAYTLNGKLAKKSMKNVIPDAHDFEPAGQENKRADEFSYGDGGAFTYDENDRSSLESDDYGGADMEDNISIMSNITVVLDDEPVSQTSNDFSLADSQLSYNPQKRYFVMPDENGTTHVVDSEIEDDTRRFISWRTGWRMANKIDDFLTSESHWAKAQFYLYTRDYNITPEELHMDRLEDSHFNPHLPTKVVVHGWRGNLTSQINELIKNGFLTAGEVNVIVVDWSDGSFAPYITAYRKVESVGTQISRMLRKLFAKFGRNYDDADLHLVGHSLGAHAVGFAGRKLGGKIDRITGLDPALPKWDSAGSGRLNKTDAKYVEVIHTNAGIAGHAEPIGHVDFYPNGGVTMPGCSYFKVACSHGRSYEYFAESLTRDAFFGQKCDDETSAMMANCEGDDILKMGGLNISNPIIPGIYLLTTNDAPPYGKNATI